jgi:hypothetical protein
MPRSIFCIIWLLIGLQALAQVAPGRFLILAPIGSARAAEAWLEDLEQALLLPELLAAVQDEGRAYGRDLDDQFLAGNGGSSWHAEVARIYDPARLRPIVHGVLQAELADRPGDIAAMIGFFRSDLGERIVTLELSARRALQDDAIEEAAHATLDRMEANNDARLRLLRDYVRQNDLVELNVVSALNANMAFLRALSLASGGDRMPEVEILAQVRAQEEEMRRDTDRWMMTFASLAYAPLTDDELRAYADFSRTEAGIALNNALFAAFDTVFSQVSGDLGKAVGRWIAGTNL